MAGNHEPLGSAAGGLGSSALLELWCWFWAGIAEREQRIWTEFFSSRDTRKEKQALIELRYLMLRHLAGPAEKHPDEEVFDRLSGGAMPADVAERFEAELRQWYARAEKQQTGKELGGNDWDALEIVLCRLLPIVARLRTDATMRSPASGAPGSLTPAGAFRFHAWLAYRIELLERLLEPRDLSADQRARHTKALPSYRMMLGQWIASLPPDPDRGGYYDSTHRQLGLGLEPRSVLPLAGWILAEADRWGGHQNPFVVAFTELAAACAITPEALVELAPRCPPPWTPPDPLPRAYLSGVARPGGLIVATMVDSEGEKGDRWEVPFHQFLAALDRG